MPTWGDPAAEEARAIAATCDGVRIWSLYIPNGRSLEDPHLTYKLEWLSALEGAARGWLADDPAAQIALMVRQLGHTPPWSDYLRFARPQATASEGLDDPELDDSEETETEQS